MSEDTKKKYNLSLARGYSNKYGFWSVTIGPEEYDAIQKIEIGGKLVFNILRAESKKSDKSPDGYFQYMDKEDVQRFYREREKVTPSPAPVKIKPKVTIPDDDF